LIETGQLSERYSRLPRACKWARFCEVRSHALLSMNFDLFGRKKNLRALDCALKMRIRAIFYFNPRKCLKSLSSDLCLPTDHVTLRIAFVFTSHISTAINIQ
jgi:hypothetical protein